MPELDARLVITSHSRGECVMKKIIPLIALLICHTATAAPVTWTLDDVAFAAGTTATGQFNYDANTNTYSDVSITVTLGDIDNYDEWLTPETIRTYTEFNEWLGGDNSADGANNAVDEVVRDDGFLTAIVFEIFVLDFAENLTNSGGTVNLLSSSSMSQRATYLGCEYFMTCGLVFSENLVSGSISAVPMPPAIWLFGSALAGLGWMRRKQTV